MARFESKGDGIRLSELLEIPNFDADRFWAGIPLLLILGDEEGYASTGLLRIAGTSVSSTSAIDLRNEVVASPSILEALVVPVASKTDPTGTMPVSLGRSQGRDICINHKSISKYHAQFLPAINGQPWRIRDCGSSNGTWIEGNRLGPDDTFFARGFSDMTFGALHCRFVHPSAVTALVDLIISEQPSEDTPDPDVNPGPEPVPPDDPRRRQETLLDFQWPPDLKPR